MTALRRWFIAGLIVLIPIAGTVLFVRWLIGFSDYALALLPEAYRPAMGIGAIVIGHPYAGTLRFLEGMISEQEMQQITLVNDLLHAPAI